MIIVQHTTSEDYPQIRYKVIPHTITSHQLADGKSSIHELNHNMNIMNPLRRHPSFSLQLVKSDK